MRRSRVVLTSNASLIGLGGTGKGTFIRLLLNLIGMSNACSSDLDDFCNNRFEAARLSVSLVVFADTDKQVGKLGKFLSLLVKTLYALRRRISEDSSSSMAAWSLSLLTSLCSRVLALVGSNAVLSPSLQSSPSYQETPQLR